MVINFHRTLDSDWLWCLVAMLVTIESKVTTNGKFYATGPRRWCKTTYMLNSCQCDEMFNREIYPFSLNALIRK